MLVFSPHFPTYPPNIFRREARMVLSNLQASHDFRPDLADVKRFLAEDPSPRAIFLNSPHNPTGGVALREDLEGLANLIRGRDVAVFSDEPYDRMVWQGRHHSLLEFPGMMDQAVAGYVQQVVRHERRLGFAVSSPAISSAGQLITARSLRAAVRKWRASPPCATSASTAMRRREFKRKWVLVAGLNRRRVSCLMPGGTFYVFPSWRPSAPFP